MRGTALILLSLSLAWGGLANAGTSGEANATYVTCGKPADVVDDNGAVLFTLGEYERLILEPGWMDVTKDLGKKNVLVKAFFPAHQNTRAWVNAYKIAAIDKCDHFSTQNFPSDTRVDTSERRQDGNAPVDVEAGKNYRICAEDDTAVIFNKSLVDSGLKADKYEKIYLESGWQTATQIVKVKKKKYEVTPVAFPGRGFIRGYVLSAYIVKFQECSVYRAEIAKLEEKARLLDAHAVALSDQFGGYATAELQKQARIARLEALNAPQKFARTEEAIKMAELRKIKEGILKDADDAEKAAHAAYVAQVKAYQEFQTAESAAATADAKAASARKLYEEQTKTSKQIIESINSQSTLEERMKLGPSMIMTASFDVNRAFAEQEAKDFHLLAEQARKASFEASIEALRLRIAAIRARAEAIRYRFTVFPLPLREEDLSAIPEHQKSLDIQIRYLSEVSSLVARAKAEAEAAYNSRRAAGGNQMIQFFRQIDMDNALKAKASAEENYKTAFSAWQNAYTEVSDAREILRLITGDRLDTDSVPPAELAEAQKRLADARANSAKLYVELLDLEVEKEKAALAAEQAADKFLSDFVSAATDKANSNVSEVELRSESSEKELERREEEAKAVKAKLEKIMGLLRDLIESNKSIRKAKRKKEDAEIDATVAENMVKQAQGLADQAIADLKGLQLPAVPYDSRLETYQEAAAQLQAKKIYDAVFEAEELAKIEPLKVKAAEEHVRAANLKVEEMEARVKSAELILQIEQVKKDGLRSSLIEKCEGDVATARANVASAQAELNELIAKLSVANESMAAAEKRAAEAREVITQGNERVRASAARQEAEQKKREEAAAQAAAAVQAAREAEWKRMAALYPPGYETARTEAYKNYVKWARKNIEGFAQKAEAAGIPWQEEGLQVVPGEIADEVVDEMVDKYKGKPCRLDDTDELKCMSCNLWYEARGETYEGKLLSGRSVMNRVKAKAAEIPTVCGTIQQYHWYSWMNILWKRKGEMDMDHPNRKPAPTETLKNGKPNGEFWAYKEGMKAAIQILQEETPYILNHYWAVGINPKWARNSRICQLTKTRIDDHYACYIPIGEDELTMDEVKAMLEDSPEEFGREEAK